jgi:hypothetical protein
LNNFLSFSGLPKPRENVWRSVGDIAQLLPPKGLNMTLVLGPTKNPPHMKTPNTPMIKTSTKEMPSPNYGMKYFRSPDEVSPIKKRISTFADLPKGLTNAPVIFCPAKR